MIQKILSSLLLFTLGLVSFAPSSNANHFGMFFNLYKRQVKFDGTSHYWSDNTYAHNCNEYYYPANNSKYNYKGQTGNGLYTIQPSGGGVQQVYCAFTSGGNGYDDGGFTYSAVGDYNNGYYFSSYNDGGRGPLSCPVAGTYPSVFSYRASVTCNEYDYNTSQLACLYNRTYTQQISQPYYYWGDGSCVNYGDRCSGVPKTYYQYYRCK
jgi:hypothetical protein